MKKLLILSNVLLLTIIIYGSCGIKSEKKTNTGNIEIPPADSNSIAGCPKCVDYSKEGFAGVPVSAAATLANLYAANHYTKYTINGAMDDSRAVWFSLDTLKKFIYKIEQAMCNCSNKHELGLRMYFGEYPDLVNNPVSSGYFSTIDARMSMRHTLFMVPTYSTNGGDDYDFDPFHLGKGGCEKPSTICELVDSYDTTFNNGNMMALSPDDSKGSKNHGNMCPPLCPEKASCFPTVMPKEGLKVNKKTIPRK